MPPFACVAKRITGPAVPYLGYDRYESETTYMSGLNAAVILRENIGDVQLGDVNTILGGVAIEFKRSRKGHNWDFTAAIDDSPPHSYLLQLVATKKHAYDYENELLERDLDFDTAPAAFEIVAYCSDESDQIVCKTLANKLTEMFDGINLGLRR